MTEETPALPELNDADHLGLALGFLATGNLYLNALRKIRDSEKAHGDKLPPERAEILARITEKIADYERVIAMPVPKPDEPLPTAKPKACYAYGRA